MLFLGAALPATQKMVVRPRAARTQRFRCMSLCRLSGVLISVPCDCMHKGRSCPQRNDILSRLFAVDYMLSSALGVSSLSLMDSLGHVRNTKVGRCEAKLVGSDQSA